MIDHFEASKSSANNAALTWTEADYRRINYNEPPLCELLM